MRAARGLFLTLLLILAAAAARGQEYRFTLERGRGLRPAEQHVHQVQGAGAGGRPAGPGRRPRRLLPRGLGRPVLHPPLSAADRGDWARDLLWGRLRPGEPFGQPEPDDLHLRQAEGRGEAGRGGGGAVGPGPEGGDPQDRGAHQEGLLWVPAGAGGAEHQPPDPVQEAGGAGGGRPAIRRRAGLGLRGPAGRVRPGELPGHGHLLRERRAGGPAQRPQRAGHPRGGLPVRAGRRAGAARGRAGPQGPDRSGHGAQVRAGELPQEHGPPEGPGRAQPQPGPAYAGGVRRLLAAERLRRGHRQQRVLRRGGLGAASGPQGCRSASRFPRCFRGARRPPRPASRPCSWRT